jgi:hypothetical protein
LQGEVIFKAGKVFVHPGSKNRDLTGYALYYGAEYLVSTDIYYIRFRRISVRERRSIIDLMIPSLLGSLSVIAGFRLDIGLTVVTIVLLIIQELANGDEDAGSPAMGRLIFPITAMMIIFIIINGLRFKINLP